MIGQKEKPDIPGRGTTFCAFILKKTLISLTCSQNHTCIKCWEFVISYDIIVIKYNSA